MELQSRSFFCQSLKATGKVRWVNSRVYIQPHGTMATASVKYFEERRGRHKSNLNGLKTLNIS